MTSFAYAQGFLDIQAPITTASAAALDTWQPYNASAGALAPPVVPLSTVSPGATVVYQKDPLDLTSNMVTVTFAGTDSMPSGGTQIRMMVPGQYVQLQACTVNGTKFWKVVNQHKANTVTQSFTFPGTLVNNSVGVFPEYVEQPSALFIVRASLTTPSAGASVIIDLLRGSTAGTPSVYTNANDRPTIVAAGTTDLGNPSNLITFDPGEFIVPKVAQIGATTTEGATLTMNVVLREIA